MKTYVEIKKANADYSIICQRCKSVIATIPRSTASKLDEKLLRLAGKRCKLTTVLAKLRELPDDVAETNEARRRLTLHVRERHKRDRQKAFILWNQLEEVRDDGSAIVIELEGWRRRWRIPYLHIYSGEIIELGRRRGSGFPATYRAILAFTRRYTVFIFTSQSYEPRESIAVFIPAAESNRELGGLGIGEVLKELFEFCNYIESRTGARFSVENYIAGFISSALESLSREDKEAYRHHIRAATALAQVALLK